MLTLLMQLLQKKDKELVSKAVYALGALIRNSHEGQSQFIAANGGEVLMELLLRHETLPVLRKTLNLIHDLADTEVSAEVYLLHVV